jgi:hypothetical protein
MYKHTSKSVPFVGGIGSPPSLLRHGTNPVAAMRGADRSLITTEVTKTLLKSLSKTTKKQKEKKSSHLMQPLVAADAPHN